MFRRMRVLLVVLFLTACPPVGLSAQGLHFTSVSVGGAHSCGVTTDSVVYCWGRNDRGQLGDSSTEDRAVPTRVAGGIAFRSISAGGSHTCAVAADGAPYCWGANDSGQLGLGTTRDQNYPARVGFTTAGMGTMRVSAISAGARHTCALIIHWERQDQMFCWGANSSGQLGIRAPGQQLNMTRVALSPQPTFGADRYSSVATGSQHTCGVSKQGSVYCWGENGRGQLGNASRTGSPVRFPVRMRRRETFSSVTVGAAHSCALTSAGLAYCWGDNSAGQLGGAKGASALTPVPLADSLKFTALSAGGDATCGIRVQGSIWCRGSIPAVPSLALAAISLGPTQACGLRTDGTVYCWENLGGLVGQ
jgi:alpha-tubulin suppressor-like RCC1 family protein